MTQTIVIDNDSNPAVGEPLLQCKQTKFRNTKAFKHIEADLNDNKNMEIP